MRISSKIMADNIKYNLAKQSNLLMDSQTKIASGKQINSISDDPNGMEKVLRYRTTLSKIDQYQENITDAKTRSEYSETVLEQINEAIDSAKMIADGADTDNREALALQISSIKDQLLGLANTTYNGNYLFHGQLTDTAPFEYDTLSGNYVYVDDADPGSHENTRVMIGEGAQVSFNADGSEIFADAAGTVNAFDVLDDLEAALYADDDAAIAATVAPLEAISEQVELVRAQNAGVYRRLESSEAHWTTFSEAVEDMRSNVEDADVTRAALDLQLQEASYEVLLRVAADVIQPTLIDFL